MTTANSIDDESTTLVFAATVVAINVNVVIAAAAGVVFHMTTLLGALQTVIILLGDVTTC